VTLKPLSRFVPDSPDVFKSGALCSVALWIGVLLVSAFGNLNCVPAENVVVVYTSRDQLYAEPVLKAFERETGIQIRAVYDTGATKTAGLTNRLLAEKDSPQADVFWNSEVVRTIVLKKAGVLSPYRSAQATGIQASFRDMDESWTGFAARARVIIYNRTQVAGQDVPMSIFDLVQPKWRGKVALGTPVLGTMAAHHTALFVKLGDQRAKDYFEDLKRNQVRIVVGNTAVKDAVSRGDVPLGIIDTSDAYEAIQSGAPVAVLYPDQKDMGTLIVPNTVALINGGPHPNQGMRLVDYLLRPETERELAFSTSAQIPLRNSVETPPWLLRIDDIKRLDVEYDAVAARLDDVCEYLANLFIN
jgi:iron(III) transport system substrate-binding protein